MAEGDWLRVIHGNREGWNLKEAVPDTEVDPERFAVKAWILQQADGKCENCGGDTFLDDEGQWYLEVHHLGLAHGGSDTPGNTVALCPNCHRAFHYSAERSLLKKRLIDQLSRLSDETSKELQHDVAAAGEWCYDRENERIEHPWNFVRIRWECCTISPWRPV